MSSPAAPHGLRRLAAPEVRELIVRAGQAGEQVALVDVREDYEYEAGHLEGALHIPLGELARRMGEIPRDTTPVFICHAGGRSFAAAQMALHAGFDSAVNLEGGMVAWTGLPPLGGPALVSGR